MGILAKFCLETFLIKYNFSSCCCFVSSSHVLLLRESRQSVVSFGAGDVEAIGGPLGSFSLFFKRVQTVSRVGDVGVRGGPLGSSYLFFREFRQTGVWETWEWEEVLKVASLCF